MRSIGLAAQRPPDIRKDHHAERSRPTRPDPADITPGAEHATAAGPADSVTTSDAASEG